MAKHLYLLIAFTCIFSLTMFAQEQNKVGDILDIKAYPEIKSKTSGLFMDQGAWFGFCLLPDTSNIIGFGGPWAHSDKKWLSVSLAQLDVKDFNNQIIKFKKISQVYRPGVLESTFRANELELKLLLIYGENGIAFQYATITNKAKSKVKVVIGWKGSSWQKISTDENKNLYVKLKDDRHLTIYQENTQSYFTIDTLNKSFNQNLYQPITINPKQEITTWVAMGLTFDNNELQKNQQLIGSIRTNVNQQIVESQKRWDAYLKAVLLKIKTDYDVIAIKSVMTLMSNWKKAGLDLLHDGLIPSHAVTYFDGFWAWDSWKHAVALSIFKPELAKDQIRTMFDYQDTMGMVPDCIYLDKSENNWRDSKPPLAAWAVYETFKNSNDTAFVREMIPKLEAYHVWWYKYRDVNKNGWCEFGSTDGTLEAAAWESGMDNAVRFDSVKMLHAGGVAWSMDQESVDLNGFLVAEKKFLSELCKAFGYFSKSDDYNKEYQNLKTKFDNHFFDNTKGYYFDVYVSNGKKVEVEGTEAFIPLWANISSNKSAIGVKNVIMNSRKFNTFMPIPTLAADNPKLDVKGYWRGPVWLDQAWFAVMALNNNGFSNEAKEISLKLFKNADGLLKNKPIHENYNPLTGERLKAPHFSWSACHYLLLYRMGYHMQ